MWEKGRRGRQEWVGVAARGDQRHSLWGVEPPDRGHGGGGVHAQGRQVRGLSQSCSKVPSPGSAP